MGVENPDTITYKLNGKTYYWQGKKSGLLASHSGAQVVKIEPFRVIG